MYEYPDDVEEKDVEKEDASEEADPPRQVRGLWWVFGPALAGTAIGAAWSAYYAAIQGFDPMTPVLVGGGVGLAAGAVLWAFFPYKPARRRRTDLRGRGSS